MIWARLLKNSLSRETAGISIRQLIIAYAPRVFEGEATRPPGGVTLTRDQIQKHIDRLEPEIPK
jgi:hypothetical protein